MYKVEDDFVEKPWVDWYVIEKIRRYNMTT